MKASALGASTLQQRQQQEGPDRGFFVWLSDAHVDPGYSNTSAVCARTHGGLLPSATLGCDPPASLWTSAVQAAARFGQSADFVLVTGDHVAHHPYRIMKPSLNVTSVIGGVARTLKGGFPGYGPEGFVMGCQGNNDSPLDYELEITTNASSNPWLTQIASDWQHAGVMSPQLAQAYSYGGYFETEVGGLRILSLNTIIYTAKHQPAEPIEKDPFGQLAWLRSRLRQALRDGRRVWIVGHVPPGMESFSYMELWRDQYVQEYLGLVEDPTLGNVIAAQLFGHVHADEFRVLNSAPLEAGPVLLTGALSPVYNSNPSFRVVEYDRASGKLLNVNVFWSPVPEGDGDLQWRFGYDFVGTYPELRTSVESSGGLTNDHFAKFALSLWRSWEAGGKEFSTYAMWYKTQHGSDLGCCDLRMKSLRMSLSLGTKKRFVSKYFCGLNVTTEAHFGRCAEKFSLRPVRRPSRRPPAGGAASISTEWQDYEEARRSHWGSIVTTAESAPMESLCAHMVSTAME